ncbi:MAG: EutP/PduV family microcompartment system protein [Anaerovoracaceae bacterium]
MIKKVMIIGPGNSGKTSLFNFLEDKQEAPRRRQDAIFGKKTIDVPGSYVEIPWMYKNVITLSQNYAWAVLVLVNQEQEEEVYSPGFAKVFHGKVIGVVTKCDSKPENREKAKEQLRKIGVAEPYFFISNKTGEGREDLKRYLFST